MDTVRFNIGAGMEVLLLLLKPFLLLFVLKFVGNEYNSQRERVLLQCFCLDEIRY